MADRDQAPSDEVDRIARALLQLTRHPRQVLPRRANPDDTSLDRSAFSIMAHIDEHGPLSLGELAEAFRLDVSTLNRQTAAMSRAKLIARVPDPDGGIARKFRLTPHGADRLRADRNHAAARLREILDAWSDRDRTSLARLLERLNVSIELDLRERAAR